MTKLKLDKVKQYVCDELTEQVTLGRGSMAMPIIKVERVQGEIFLTIDEAKQAARIVVQLR